MLNLFRRALFLIAPALAVAGLASAPAQAAELHVTGERTVITASPATGQFLTASHITVSTTGAASSGTDGSLILPITRGEVTTAPMNGKILHAGGVKFSNGDSTLAFRDFQLVRKHDRAYLTALEGSRRVLFAGVVRFAVSVSGNEAIVTGELKLGGEAAADFNRLIGSDAVKPGMEIGTLKSTIKIAA